jgi:hypothetical protein
MNLIRIKSQNRSRLLLLSLLSLGWSLLDPAGIYSTTEFLVGSFLFLILTVTLGNFTNYLLNKVGVDFRENKSPEDILDDEVMEIRSAQSEDEKDRWALNYGIFWALVLVILTLIL